MPEIPQIITMTPKSPVLEEDRVSGIITTDVIRSKWAVKYIGHYHFRCKESGLLVLTGII